MQLRKERQPIPWVRKSDPGQNSVSGWSRGRCHPPDLGRSVAITSTWGTTCLIAPSESYLRTEAPECRPTNTGTGRIRLQTWHLRLRARPNW